MNAIRGRGTVLAAAGLAAAALVVRRFARRSGATTGEVDARLPGDELVRAPSWQSTRAITITEQPAAVWPWIVQMGYPAHRGGWYTPYWLDRLQWGIQERSADRIRPELQELRVGDKVPDSPDWSVYFTVEEIQPERALVLHSTRHLLKPLRTVDFSWAFVVEPTPNGSCRLVIRARASGEPRAAWLLLAPLIGVGDFLNASVMLRGIKRRSEAAGP